MPSCDDRFAIVDLVSTGVVFCGWVIPDDLPIVGPDASGGCAVPCVLSGREKEVSGFCLAGLGNVDIGGLMGGGFERLQRP